MQATPLAPSAARPASLIVCIFDHRLWPATAVSRRAPSRSGASPTPPRTVMTAKARKSGVPGRPPPNARAWPAGARTTRSTRSASAPAPASPGSRRRWPASHRRKAPAWASRPRDGQPRRTDRGAAPRAGDTARSSRTVCAGRRSWPAARTVAAARVWSQSTAASSSPVAMVARWGRARANARRLRPGLQSARSRTAMRGAGRCR
jgi:hypothetical protein